MAELIVKPILTYSVYRRAEATSWREWGGIASEEDARREAERIEGELRELASRADFPLRLLPLSLVRRPEDIGPLEGVDALLLYAAGGSEGLLLSVLSRGLPTVVFLRHRSGPLYLWYEIIDARVIRRYTDRIAQPWLDYDDVVVDDYGEVLWRLRALYGLKCARGARVVAIGGASGWGIGRRAVELAAARWNLEVVEVPYSELEERLRRAMGDPRVLGEAERRAGEYLATVSELATRREFVTRAFVLYQVFKELLEEHGARVLTVNECMSTIMRVARTTACLVLSLLNDEGYLALCESDFVAIPAGILLHYISGKPVFFADPTLPHGGIVTVAHCTAPRRMDGRALEPARLLTHFESDYGVAPKVEFRRGQVVTVLIPDFSEETWVGFRGRIVDAPDLPICRSQAEIEVEGDWRRLLRELRGFHWVIVYGDYLCEVEYALRRVGIRFVRV